MTDNDNDDDADDSDFNDTVGEIFSVSFGVMVTPSLDLDLAFGAFDSNINLDHIQLLSPLAPPPAHLPSPFLLLLLLLMSPSEIQKISRS